MRHGPAGLTVVLLSALPATASAAWTPLPPVRAEAGATLSAALRADGALGVASESGRRTRVRVLARGARAWRDRGLSDLVTPTMLGGRRFGVVGIRARRERIHDVVLAPQRASGRFGPARRLDPRRGYESNDESLQVAQSTRGRALVGWQTFRSRDRADVAFEPVFRQRSSTSRIGRLRRGRYVCAAALNDRGDALVLLAADEFATNVDAQTWFADGRRSRRQRVRAPCPTFDTQVSMALSSTGAAAIAWTTQSFDDGVSGAALPGPVEAVVRSRWGRLSRPRRLARFSSSEISLPSDRAVSVAFDTRGRGVGAWLEDRRSGTALVAARLSGGRIGSHAEIAAPADKPLLVGAGAVAGRRVVAWGEGSSATAESRELRVTATSSAGGPWRTERVREPRPDVSLFAAQLLTSSRPARLHLLWKASSFPGPTRIEGARRALGG